MNQTSWVFQVSYIILSYSIILSVDPPDFIGLPGYVPSSVLSSILEKEHQNFKHLWVMCKEILKHSCPLTKDSLLLVTLLVKLTEKQLLSEVPYLHLKITSNICQQRMVRDESIWEFSKVKLKMSNKNGTKKLKRTMKSALGNHQRKCFLKMFQAVAYYVSENDDFNLYFKIFLVICLHICIHGPLFFLFHLL